MKRLPYLSVHTYPASPATSQSKPHSLKSSSSQVACTPTRVAGVAEFMCQKSISYLRHAVRASPVLYGVPHASDG